MRIFRLELKRVLKSRLTWILLALALILSVLLAYLPTTYCYSNYADESGNEINLTGLASIAYEKERQADSIGIVTPERVREAVEIYQASIVSHSGFPSSGKLSHRAFMYPIWAVTFSAQRWLP